MHPCAEGQVGQDRQLLRGVGAVDVHRRIGLGKAQSLGLLDRRGIVGALLFHLRHDEIAGPVQDAAQRLVIWLADRHWLMLAMIGMPPATDASKAIDRPSCAGRVEQLAAMLGQQRLVGRDDVLAAVAAAGA